MNDFDSWFNRVAEEELFPNNAALETLFKALRERQLLLEQDVAELREQILVAKGAGERAADRRPQDLPSPARGKPPEVLRASADPILARLLVEVAEVEPKWKLHYHDQA